MMWRIRNKATGEVCSEYRDHEEAMFALIDDYTPNHYIETVNDTVDKDAPSKNHTQTILMPWIDEVAKQVGLRPNHSEFMTTYVVQGVYGTYSVPDLITLLMRRLRFTNMLCQAAIGSVFLWLVTVLIFVWLQRF